MLREFHPSLHLLISFSLPPFSSPFSVPHSIRFNLSKWIVWPQGLNWQVDKQDLSSWKSFPTCPHPSLGLETPQRKQPLPRGFLSNERFLGDSLGKDGLNLGSPESGKCDWTNSRVWVSLWPWQVPVDRTLQLAIRILKASPRKPSWNLRLSWAQKLVLH